MIGFSLLVVAAICVAFHIFVHFVRFGEISGAKRALFLLIALAVAMVIAYHLHI